MNEDQPTNPDIEVSATQPAEEVAPAEPARVWEPGELMQAVEALVFVTPGGVTVRKLSEVLGCPAHQVQKAAEQLRERYREHQSGLDILPVAGGYQLVTVPAVASLVDALLTVVRRRHLSQPAMETLAIVAYRQPITKPEIEAIRGVDSSGVLNGLLDKKLLRPAGRKKAPGKPLLYATTREFLLHFGLRDLRELPALGELGRRPGEEVEVLEELEEREDSQEPASTTGQEGAADDGTDAGAQNA